MRSCTDKHVIKISDCARACSPFAASRRMHQPHHRGKKGNVRAQRAFRIRVDGVVFDVRSKYACLHSCTGENWVLSRSLRITRAHTHTHTSRRARMHLSSFARRFVAFLRLSSTSSTTKVPPHKANKRLDDSVYFNIFRVVERMSEHTNLVLRSVSALSGDWPMKASHVAHNTSINHFRI